jgi:acylphosphatase
MSDKTRFHIFVSGRVQGVFFRESARRKAKKLGINGWVKNLADSRMETLLEGDKEKMEEMIRWIKKGPIFAKVEGMEVLIEEYQGEFDDFEIKYG